jgi:hypothetical protein
MHDDDEIHEPNRTGTEPNKNRTKTERYHTKITPPVRPRVRASTRSRRAPPPPPQKQRIDPRRRARKRPRGEKRITFENPPKKRTPGVKRTLFTTFSSILARKSESRSGAVDGGKGRPRGRPTTDDGRSTTRRERRTDKETNDSVVISLCPRFPCVPLFGPRKNRRRRVRPSVWTSRRPLKSDARHTKRKISEKESFKKIFLYYHIDVIRLQYWYFDLKDISHIGVGFKPIFDG